MRFKRLKLVVATAVLLLATAPVAMAIPVGIGAFGPGTTVESFEGLAAAIGPNLAVNSNYFEPGVTDPYTFASGVTLTDPIPNPGVFSAEGILIGDFAYAAYVTFGLTGNGFIGSAADVPFGSAYLGLNGTAAAVGPIEFTFASDMLRVGAYVTGTPGNITLTAYDQFGGLLESTSLATINVALWGNNFIGLENVAGIRSIEFSGADYAVLDGLSFEAAVPEPSTLLLLGSGIIGLGGLGFVRRRFRG